MVAVDSIGINMDVRMPAASVAEGEERPLLPECVPVIAAGTLFASDWSPVTFVGMTRRPVSKDEPRQAHRRRSKR